MLTVAFRTIGCRLNQAETQDLQKEFLQAGWAIKSARGAADFLIVNTCSVTHAADRKSRQAIREFKNRNPRSKIIVLGCGAAAQKDLAEVNLTIENKNKSRALKIINKGFDIKKTKVEANKSSVEKNETNTKSEDKVDRTRLLVKIQEGCDAKCTYCIVPRLRGKPQSLPFKKILRSIKDYEAEGVKEIILTGVHIGQYLDGQVDLFELLQKILIETNVSRLRLSSIEPQHFDSRILSLFANKRVCPFLHIPIQSGADSILQAMGRKYTAASVAAMIAEIRRKVPDIWLSTDIIVGFPGETDADYQYTYSFCRQLNFAKIHVFSYSKREGTPAASFPRQVQSQVVKNRSAKLRALSDKMNFAFRRQFLNKEVSVLWENSDQGVTREGIKVCGGNHEANTISREKIKDIKKKITYI